MFTKRNYLVGIIIFVAVWVVIFAVPQTRALFHSQIWRTNIWGITKIFKPFDENKAIVRLAKKYPDDPRIQASLVQNATINTSSSTEYHLYRMHEYDKLINRFPKTTWLITNRLRESAGKFRSVKGAYFIVDNSTKRYLNSKNWMSDEEIKQTLKIAQLGEKRDPNNSFCNWIEAMCWYGLNDSANALNALQRGSHKIAFDDGILQNIKNQLYVQQLSTYPLLEDRWMIYVSPILLHLNILQEINQNAIWQGAMAEKSGNHQKALEIYGAQIRLNAVMLENSTSTINRLVAQAMLVPSWIAFNRRKALGANKSYGLGLMNSPEKRTVLLRIAHSFADYASAHYRTDLAVQTVNIAHAIVDDHGLSGRSADDLLPISLIQLSQIGFLKWIGMELLTTIFIGIVFTLCVLPVNSLLKNIEQSNTVLNHTSPKIFDISLGIIFIVICIATSAIFVLARIPDNTDLFLSLFPNQLIQDEQGASHLFYILNTWLPWSIFILLSVWCFLAAFWRARKSAFAQINALLNNSPANKILLIVGRGIFWLIALIFQAWWTEWLVMQPAGKFPLINHFFFLAIPVPLILFLILNWYLQRSQTTRGVFSSERYWLLFATWLQRSLALLILICTLAYGVTSWASLPLRHNANITLDHVLKVGEVAALREALAKDKSQHSD
jgi:hypothetical protein